MLDLSEILQNKTLWQMSYAERMSIFYLINKMEKRKVAIEIGTFHGGFLQHLSKYFDKVYSCDIDHSNVKNKELYENVVWIEGDSKVTIPKLIQDLSDKDEDVNFILVDGDHSYDGVLRDINNVLKYNPKSETIILVHDSWYRPSRNAINHAKWNENPYLQLVEKDFVVGDMMLGSNGNIFVGGLALAVMTNEKRRDKVKVEIKQTYDYMYRVIDEILVY